MALAGMWSAAKDELICDFAETYHIYDLRALPVRTLAVLACGLGKSSRVWAKTQGFKARWSEIVLAMCADRLAIIAWQNTESGSTGENFPTLLTPELLGMSDQSEKRYETFDTGADFMAEWNRL